MVSDFRQSATTDPNASIYMNALSDAVNAFTDDLLVANSRNLEYRGASFKRFANICLFYSLVNEKALYQVFCDSRQGARDLDFSQLPTIATWPLPHLLSSPGARRDPSLWASVRSAATLIQQIAANTKAASPAPPIQFANRAEGCSILFHVGAYRFVRYAAPILANIGDGAAYLCIGDQALMAEIAATNSPVMNIETSSLAAPVGHLTQAMEDWTSACSEFDLVLEALRKQRASTLVLIEGGTPINELLARAAEVLGMRTVCIQQGWSPIVHAGFRNMRFDNMCVWGSEFANMLAPHNPRQEFSITGSHVLRDMVNIGPSPPGAIAFFLQKGSLLITDAAWQQMLDFICWTASTFPQREVLVREHPAVPLSAGEQTTLEMFGNIALIPAGEAALADVLRRCQCAVSIFSTTLIEAAACGVLPLIVNVTGMPRYSPDLEAMGAGVEVHNFDVARSALSRILVEPNQWSSEQLAGVRNRFFKHSGQAAIDAITKVIAQGRLSGV